MALTLMFITNDVEIAKIAENNGVDRIWIDLETLGKEERQKGMNTVKSNHTVADIYRIKSFLSRSQLLVRVNPWNSTSKDEIDKVVAAGADMIMLPMWKSVSDVECFLSAVDGRCKTTLLLETKEALECIDEVLEKGGFDEIHIGLNDLHLSLGLTFMFEPLGNGIVEELCSKFAKKGIPYGFGGVACIGKGELPAEKIIMEHYRLGSTRAILSRSFCDVAHISSVEEVALTFEKNMADLKMFESGLSKATEAMIRNNQNQVIETIDLIVRRKNHNA